MTKKGFTLIELLAVILILGIIALIAIPVVNNIMKTIKKQSMNVTIQNIAKAAEQKCQMQELKGEVTTTNYIITNGISDKELEIKGKLPESGAIIVDDKCNVLVSFDDEDISGIKTFTNEEVTVNEKKAIVPPDSCFTYTDVDGGVAITGYSCGDSVNSVVYNEQVYNYLPIYNQDGQYTDIIIPNELGGKTVVAINDYAFVPTNAYSKTGIRSIKFNDSLISVGSYAFVYNELLNVEFNNSLQTIENYAFAMNKLTVVNLPDSIKTISHMSFGANFITEYYIPDTIENFDNASFNNNCLPEESAFITVEDQGYNVLISYGGINKNPVIPSDIDSIGTNAFYFSGLTGITIPSNIIYIQPGALNCNFLKDSDAFIYKKNLDGSFDMTTVVSYAGSNRENIMIPEGVTTIASYSMAYDYIESITFPSTLKKIEDYAFRENDLVTLDIPNNVTTISGNSFYSNSELKTINVDKSNGAISNAPWGASNATINYLR